MSQGLPESAASAASANIAPPRGYFLSGWLAAQLLLAVFLIPALDHVERLRDSYDPGDWPRLRFNPYAGNFSSRANLLWVLQTGLVLNVLGSTSRQLPIRWAALLAAIFYLIVQDGTHNYHGGLYLSLASIAGVYLIWDPSPLGWRILVGTAVGFLLAAAHYQIFERNASAFANGLLLLHYAVVSSALLIARAAGWRLELAEAAGSGAQVGTARFTFAQLLIWVTCCGLGLALLRYVNFAGAQFLTRRDFLAIGDQELFWGLVISGIISPGICVLAVWATLTQRWSRYWLGLLTVAGSCLVGLEYFRPNPLLSLTLGFRPAPPRTLIATLYDDYDWLIMTAAGVLLVAALPTALMLVYRAAGFRWVRGPGVAMALQRANGAAATGAVR